MAHNMSDHMSTHDTCSSREKRQENNTQLSPETTHKHGTAEDKGGAASFLWSGNTSLQGFSIPPETCPGFVRQTGGIIVKVSVVWTCIAGKWDCSGALRHPLRYNTDEPALS